MPSHYLHRKKSQISFLPEKIISLLPYKAYEITQKTNNYNLKPISSEKRIYLYTKSETFCRLSTILKSISVGISQAPSYPTINGISAPIEQACHAALQFQPIVTSDSFL